MMIFYRDDKSVRKTGCHRTSDSRGRTLAAGHSVDSIPHIVIKKDILIHEHRYATDSEQPPRVHVPSRDDCL